MFIALAGGRENCRKARKEAGRLAGRLLQQFRQKMTLARSHRDADKVDRPRDSLELFFFFFNPGFQEMIKVGGKGGIRNDKVSGLTAGWKAVPPQNPRTGPGPGDCGFDV